MRLGRGGNVVSGIFPGSPQSISEQLIISSTCQGLVFLEEMTQQCLVRAASLCKTRPTSGGLCTGAKSTLRPVFLI